MKSINFILNRVCVKIKKKCKAKENWFRTCFVRKLFQRIWSSSSKHLTKTFHSAYFAYFYLRLLFFSLARFRYTKFPNFRFSRKRAGFNENISTHFLFSRRISPPIWIFKLSLSFFFSPVRSRMTYNFQSAVWEEIETFAAAGRTLDRR